MSKEVRKIEVNDILLNRRKLFLFDEVSDENVYQLIKKMYALDDINKKPIELYINSCGGSIVAGFALIDIMNKLNSPIYTYIVGQAVSMGGIISIAGKKRFISYNSMWMFHPPSGGGSDDSFQIQRARFKSMDFVEQRCDELLKKHTKLTKNEIADLKITELWFDYKECLKRGIVDSIIS